MIKVIQMVMTAFMVIVLTYSMCHEQQEGLSCLEEDEEGLNNDQVLHIIELVNFCDPLRFFNFSEHLSLWGGPMWMETKRPLPSPNGKKIR